MEAPASIYGIADEIQVNSRQADAGDALAPVVQAKVPDRWQRWIEQESAKSAIRAAAATQAQGKSRAEVAAAVHEVIPAWDGLGPSALSSRQKEKLEQELPELSKRAAQAAEQWRQWIEKNVGGPAGRIDLAMRAAMNSLGQGKNSREVAAAALKAASLWRAATDSSEDNATVRPVGKVTDGRRGGGSGTVDPLQGLAKQQWQEWIKKNIGGPEGRVAVATNVAMDAFNQGRNSKEIASAALKAASLWKDPGSLDSDKAVVRPTAMMPKTPRGVIVGTVRFLQTRQESARVIWTRKPHHMAYTLVWDFRLDSATSDGTPIPSVAVELRSPAAGFWGATTKGIHGSLLNGDLVAVDARGYKTGEVLQIKQLWNFETRSFVWAVPLGSRPSRVFDALIKLSPEKYGVIRGRVIAMQQRLTRPGYYFYSPTTWSFRVQRKGPDGCPLPTIAVEMQARSFKGSLTTGDEVEVDARGYKSGDLVIVPKIRNLTSNAVVQGQASPFTPVMGLENTRLGEHIRMI